MERLCGNCCFRKNGECLMSKKKIRERVLETESAVARKCKYHLFKEGTDDKDSCK